MIATLVATLLAAAPPRPVTIGTHRGLAEGMPENTIAAFRQSLARGVAVIELDLRTTKDGHLVILHDPTLDRTTDCSGSIAEQSLANIRKCDAGWPTHNGELVPTFAEVLALARNSPSRLLLDCKAAPLDAVLREVRAHRAESRVIIGLRSAREIARARAELPAAIIIAFMPGRTDAPAFVEAGADIIRLWSDWVEYDPELVARTQALGKPVWIMVGRKLPRGDGQWRGLHERMIASGADGLITNRSDLISPP